MFGRNAARAHLILGTIGGLFAALNIAIGIAEWRNPH